MDELGFTNFIDQFRIQYLNPLARILFGDEYLGETGLDSHKAFVVSYKIGEDIDLGYHYDNAEITLNVSLGKYLSTSIQLSIAFSFSQEVNLQMEIYFSVPWLNLIELYFRILPVRSISLDGECLMSIDFSRSTYSDIRHSSSWSTSAWFRSYHIG